MDSTRLPLTSTRVFAILSCCLVALSRWNEPSEDGKVCKQRDARRQHQSTDVCQGHVPKHSNTKSSLDCLHRHEAGLFHRFVPVLPNSEPAASAKMEAKFFYFSAEQLKRVPTSDRSASLGLRPL